VPVMSNQEFLLQQGFLGSGFQALRQLNIYVQSGLNLVVFSQDVDVETDLITPYAENYNNTNTDWTGPNLLTLATVALERHISQRTGQTLNDYLYTRGLKVSPQFAELSALVGYVVDASNIQS
jgi:hypothetical protein